MRKGSRTRQCHLGFDFSVWRSEGAWFWRLTNASDEGGIIGASANKAQATRDARRSIEEKLELTHCERHHYKRSIG
jgi:hypothetical protein